MIALRSLVASRHDSRQQRAACSAREQVGLARGLAAPCSVRGVCRPGTSCAVAAAAATGSSIRYRPGRLDRAWYASWDRLPSAIAPYRPGAFSRRISTQIGWTQPAGRIAHRIDHLDEPLTEIGVAYREPRAQQRLCLPRGRPARVVLAVGLQRPHQRAVAALGAKVGIDAERRIDRRRRGRADARSLPATSRAARRADLLPASVGVPSGS